MMSDDQKVRALERALGHQFTDTELRDEALTHTSYRNEMESVERDNERLEFLGDAVIECAVSHLLWERFPDATEGVLTRYRALLVSEPGLAELARSIGLGECLRLGRGEEKTGGRNKPSLLADAFESMIAAVFLDTDFTTTVNVIRGQFEPQLETLGAEPSRFDFKTRVQERVQAALRAVPRYRVERETGPDHNKIFEVALTIGGRGLSTGQGRSKKEAEQDAARSFYEELVKTPDLLDNLTE